MTHASLRTTAARSTPFYRDIRVLAIVAQIVFVLAVIGALAFLARNLINGLRASNIPLGWGFLRQEAGFEIAEGPFFDPSESYGRAFIVGIINTLRVAIAGIVLATVLGFLIGVARLSTNWLLRTLATGYVEIIRNTPVLVQIVFWYFAVILKLPDIQNNINLGGAAIISNRGVALSWPYLTETGLNWRYWLLAALVSALLAGFWRRQRLAAQGRPGSVFPAALSAFLLIAIVGYAVTGALGVLPGGIAYELRRGDRGVLFVDANGDGNYNAGVDRSLRRIPVTLLAADGTELGTLATDDNGEFRFIDLPQEGTELRWSKPAPLLWSQPELQGFNVRGGLTLTPEFAGILLGLVIYTAAFIAEIVRGGINAVAKGQWEASRALGLSGGETLRLIVIPQALRVVIPPLTSQYLNLTKNSSLAIAIGYPDLFNVSATVLNQSGAAVQMFALLMGVYLSLSLLTSALMNWYNKRVALVER